MRPLNLLCCAILLLCAPASMARAGDWATFNSAGAITGWGVQADTDVPGVDGAPDSVTINTPDGAVPITDAQLAAAPNLALSNGTVSVITPAEPTPAAPTPSSQAAAALAAGIAITSTAYPSLDGTYSIDNQAQANITAISTYILTNPGKFPTGTTTYAYLDKSGSAHLFPNTTEFQAFATAVANYASELVITEATNSGTLPSNAATIP